MISGTWVEMLLRNLFDLSVFRCCQLKSAELCQNLCGCRKASGSNKTKREKTKRKKWMCAKMDKACPNPGPGQILQNENNLKEESSQAYCSLSRKGRNNIWSIMSLRCLYSLRKAFAFGVSLPSKRFANLVNCIEMATIC